MRLWTCLGLAVVGLCACAQIPALFRIEVGGSTLGFDPKPVEEYGVASPPEAANDNEPAR